MDIVLGPAMTLFLFKPGKKSLVFDMSVIAAIQIAALAYGFYATYQQRTVAIVYSDEGFNTLSAAAHAEANLILIEKEKTPKHISDITDNRPALLGTELVTKETYGKYLADLLNNYPEPHERSDKFVELSKNIDNMLLQSMDENDIDHHANGEKIAAALKKLNRTVDDTQILNFRARYAKGVLLFDAEEQEILDFVPNKKYAATTADSDGD